jgi:CDP-diacylglycerol--glycerol-3-phosphate 3-phosphatidyltransferase
MNAAIYLTLLRLILSAPIILLIQLETVLGYSLAALLFSLAILSDILDGVVARNRNQVTNLGRWLDPLIDKILIYVVLFSLLRVGAVEAVLVFPMFVRDMIVDGLRNEASGTSAPLGANVWGKAKFSFQALSIMSGFAFCITRRSEFLSGANIALLVALVVSIPGLVAIASTVIRNSKTERAKGDPLPIESKRGARFF